MDYTPPTIILKLPQEATEPERPLARTPFMVLDGRFVYPAWVGHERALAAVVALHDGLAHVEDGYIVRDDLEG